MLLGFTIVCALSGCWQEVYYEEPGPSAPVSAPAKPSTPAAAADGHAETAISPAEQPDSGQSIAERPQEIPPSAEQSDSAPSPAERSEALTDTALQDAGRMPESADDASDETDLFADDLTASLAGDDTLPPAETTSPGDAAGVDDSGPEEPPPAHEAIGETDSLQDEPPAAEETASGEDLLGSSAPPGAESTGEPAQANAGPPNTRRMAWLLGSKWSLAALAQDRGAPRAEVEKWLEQSSALADALGVKLPALPKRAAGDGGQSAGGTAVDHLFQQGQELGRELNTRYDEQHAALFELAVKSNVLLALYQPGRSFVDVITAAVVDAADRAHLPPALCEPLLQKLAEPAPPAEVSREVFRLHTEVDRFLTAPQRGSNGR